jgi:membrane protein DedA with SNARE-associated domain
VTLESLVEHYGYVAILVGCLVEGETVLLLGGFAAHRGYLRLAGVIAAAFFGTVLGDQFYFLLGRERGRAFLARRPTWRGPLARVEPLVRRHQNLLIFGFRFLYGIRTVTPFALGFARVSPLRFLALNLPSALAWSVAVTGLGYLTGDALQALLGNLRRYEALVFAAIAATGAFLFFLRQWRLRQAALDQGDGPS